MNLTNTPIPTPYLPRYQAGLSLVELMISLAVGLLLLAGITTLIVRQSGIRDELDKASREIENGRYAMQLLRDDIEHAGFYGDYSPASGVVAVTSDPCNLNSGSTNSGWSTTPTVTVPAPIYGYAAQGSDPTSGTTCGLTSYKPNTAVLVVRRTDTATVIPASAVAGTNYLQVSRCNVMTPFVMGTSGFTLQQKDCATPALLRKYIVRVYYVSSCDVCGTDTIPTLKVVELMNGNKNTIPLVEGIENMEFDYGIDNTGDGSPDVYTTSPAVSDWQNVMAVRVNLLARNNGITAGYQDTKTYNLGGAGTVGPFNDSYKRHAYNELVRVINPSGRRE